MLSDNSFSFPYSEAFSRNIGWLTQEEQETIRTKRIAIAGMGGVGGVHLLTLARLGIEKFNISDMDTFEIGNFNRQAGAFISTIGKPKAETLANMALDINPNADIRIFPSGVSFQNMKDFFSEVDLYVDALDFFAFDARSHVFEYCHLNSIPATTVAPLGMSAALLNFLPGGPSFEGYFRLAGLSDLDKAIHFLVGLAPAALHRTYLVDKSKIDLLARKGPSTAMACQLCAGIAGTEALKILLGRGYPLGAPHGIQFDAYRNRISRTWRPGGNSNPFNRIQIAAVRRLIGL